VAPFAAGPLGREGEVGQSGVELALADLRVGAAGDGLHTPDEYVETDSLPRRAALIAGLLTGI